MSAQQHMEKTVLLFFVTCLVIINTLSFGQERKSTAPTSSTPFVLGTVDSVKSTILNETRVINIYLPEGYSPDSATRYPVIYLLDGGADEDFVHVVGLVKYNTTPWINRFPPSIVVGIASVKRQRDFTFAVSNLDFLARAGFKKSQIPVYGGSEKFISFLEKELQPFIEKRYRTSASKTIIGESLGGLLATEILLKKPALFTTYIILDPSLWWGGESLLTQAPGLLKSANRQATKVYVGSCDKANNPMMYNDAKALADSLTKYGGQLTVVFDYLPDETHATISHQGVYNAFKRLYPLKK
jgi:predicted alpha/beta superfamily hydrolase